MGNKILTNSLQEFATGIEQVTHHVFPSQHEDHIHRGPGKAFHNRTGYTGMNSVTPGKQTIGLEVIRLMENK
jgi:hypothetical protein